MHYQVTLQPWLFDPQNRKQHPYLFFSPILLFKSSLQLLFRDPLIIKFVPARHENHFALVTVCNDTSQELKAHAYWSTISVPDSFLTENSSCPLSSGDPYISVKNTFQIKNAMVNYYQSANWNTTANFLTLQTIFPIPCLCHLCTAIISHQLSTSLKLSTWGCQSRPGYKAQSLW